VSGVVHTGVKVHKIDSEICGLVDDLSFSLCAILPACHIVTTFDNGKKSEMEVSADLVYCH